MIILSGVLVVVAIALLVVGIIAGNTESAQIGGLDALTLIYISIAVSIVSLLCLIIGVFLRRKELFGTGTTGAARSKASKKRDRKGKSAVGAVPGADQFGRDEPLGRDEALDEVPVMSSVPADVPPDAVVHVVRGRKRYHLDSCRQLAGRVKEELTYAEAIEEGFSPCTACLPDTALAARAAATSGQVDEDTAYADDETETVSPAAYTRSSGSPRTGSRPGGSESTPPSERAGGVPSAWPVPKPSPGDGGSGPDERSIPSAWRPPAPAEAHADDAYAEPAEDDDTFEDVSRRGGATTEWTASRFDRFDDEVDEQEAGDEPADSASSSGGRGGSERTRPEPWSTSVSGSGRTGAGDHDDLDDLEPLTEDALGEDTFSDEAFRKAFAGEFGDEPSDEPDEPAEPDLPASGRSTADSGGSEDSPGAADARSADSGPAADSRTGSETDTLADDDEPDALATAHDEQADPHDEAAESGGTPAPAPAGDDGPMVRILSGTKRYHRADCALIEDIGDDADDLETLSREDAKARGCTPCLVCQPDREHDDD